MQTHLKTPLKYSALMLGTLSVAMSAHASTDYAPAIWNPPACTKWYTSGYGTWFAVIHDMEGYYLSSISYLNNCSVSASVHYAVNGKQDTSTDAPAGQVTQMVREAYYAWHASCWNQWMYGTEHEGFASNPAWYTDAMYNATIPLQSHLAMTDATFPKDRNHIIGHGEKSTPGWTSWMAVNYPSINAYCNTHTDPGPYWDWTRLMNGINGSGTIIVDNSNAGFSTSANWSTGSSSTDKYGGDYRFRSTAPLSDPATFTASVSGGSHTVYVWYPAGANRSTTTPFIISTSSGNVTATVNQQITGGQWVNQGAYSMNAGNNTIKVSCWTATGAVVVADAVKWQ